MIRKRSLFWAILVLVHAGADALTDEPAEEPERGVLFTGATLPAPPAQGKPWKPPADTFSKTWISALEQLFAHGFADPADANTAK